MWGQEGDMLVTVRGERVGIQIYPTPSDSPCYRKFECGDAEGVHAHVVTINLGLGLRDIYTTLDDLKSDLSRLGMTDTKPVEDEWRTQEIEYDRRKRISVSQ